MKTYVQDLQAFLDYPMDWSDFLTGSDTINASVWTSPVLTMTNPTNTTTTATVWLSGGVAETRYKISNKITTVAGRISERSFYILVKDL